VRQPDKFSRSDGLANLLADFSFRRADDGLTFPDFYLPFGKSNFSGITTPANDRELSRIRAATYNDSAAS
jgi:hypothetical protein